MNYNYLNNRGGYQNGNYYPPSPYPNYQPVMQQQTQPNQAITPNNTLVQFAFVDGVESVKSYILNPNSQACLLDDENSTVYYKKTDENGKATYKCYKMQEVNFPSTVNNIDTSNFVTKEDFNRLTDKIEGLFAKITSNEKASPTTPKTEEIIVR